LHTYTIKLVTSLVQCNIVYSISHSLFHIWFRFNKFAVDVRCINAKKTKNNNNKCNV